MTVELSGPDQLRRFFARLGERIDQPAELFVFGGSALILSGSRRNTGDIDFTLNADEPAELRATLAALAAELDLDLEESVPAEFMPLPAGADERHLPIDRFGNLMIYVFDPYSMAVMKIDRAFPTDFQDVRFLLSAGLITLDFLAQCVEDVAARYDEPLKLRRNFEELKRTLKG